VAAIALHTQVRRTPAALRALAQWGSVGRHYRPDRRYMRGGSGAHGAAARRWPSIRRAASALLLLLALAALPACDAETLRVLNERAAMEGTAGPPRNRTGDNSSS
jgi:hypothetical protein